MKLYKRNLSMFTWRRYKFYQIIHHMYHHKLSKYISTTLQYSQPECANAGVKQPILDLFTRLLGVYGLQDLFTKLLGVFSLRQCAIAKFVHGHNTRV